MSRGSRSFRATRASRRPALTAPCACGTSQSWATVRRAAPTPLVQQRPQRLPRRSSLETSRGRRRPARRCLRCASRATRDTFSLAAPTAACGSATRARARRWLQPCPWARGRCAPWRSRMPLMAASLRAATTVVVSRCGTGRVAVPAALRQALPCDRGRRTLVICTAAAFGASRSRPMTRSSRVRATRTRRRCGTCAQGRGCGKLRRHRRRTRAACTQCVRSRTRRMATSSSRRWATRRCGCGTRRRGRSSRCGAGTTRLSWAAPGRRTAPRSAAAPRTVP